MLDKTMISHLVRNGTMLLKEVLPSFMMLSDKRAITQ